MPTHEDEPQRRRPVRSDNDRQSAEIPAESTEGDPFEPHYRREQWLQAALEVTRLLQGDLNQREALQVVTRKIREVAGADFVAISSVDPTYPEGVGVIEAIEGLGVEHVLGSPVAKRGLSARAIDNSITIVSPSITLEVGYNPADEFAEAMRVLGLGMYVPLVTPEKVTGVLTIGWKSGSPHERIAANEVPMFEMFAGQAALALQQLDARRQLVHEREQVARDLSDAVIDRLFAIGTHLHGVASIVAQYDVQRTMSHAIDELDEMTQQIRNAIFALQPNRDTIERSVSDQVLEELDAASATLGFTPRLVVSGAVDSPLPAIIQRELVRAVRETLSHAATHSSPSSVEVSLSVNADQVTLTVRDDGRRGAEASPQRILRQLLGRAERLGGTCTISAATPTDTVVEWSVPTRL
ncbi:GAF domain-containing sensor histidine kinase [Actinopolymorpha pittospori]|uniref:Signal transduction histidine kinase n=1 Tax=Actinopolymorpha pittospori TaxID=648752 RepID=A0A927RC00_9ACTN|nr:GAF domain-containing sensor histidine kinase [Actinopolymorpha pittospori]MBE1609334.1 signal transduction histidine kinase [Actinopolymorpha pittospori]